MKPFAENVISFNRELKLKLKTKDVDVLNPFTNQDSRKVSETFYLKYYNDLNQRTFIFGINPGRFGAGITGVPFTDPINLKNECCIENDFKKRTEISSQFIYKMISEFGGTEKFYSQFYFTSVIPLGFMRTGKNLNYYDDKSLWMEIKPFAVNCIKKQLNFNSNKAVAFCLGERENYKHLKSLNDEFHFFEMITPLPHPRWIMQYKRKEIEHFISIYINLFKSIN